MSGDRYLLTQSLLSSWEYQYRAPDPDAAHRDFLRVLRREPGETNRAIQDGIAFEDMVTTYIQGVMPPEDHSWNGAVCQAGEIVKGSRPQVKAYQEARIGGVDFLLYGRMDYLREGIIFDTKFSRHYECGKYLKSPQHPMYFACEPGAYRFVYVVSNGEDVYTEEYRREDTAPIDGTVCGFLDYLRCISQLDTYFEYWRSNP